MNSNGGRLIISQFRRQVQDSEVYKQRLDFELKMIVSKNFTNYLLQVMEILDLVKEIPHIIRGSSGSSLVCYYLGITNIDPVKENISFARFLNNTRKNMPDIDIDFPYNRREEVFERIHDHWPDKVARISNHVHFHEKSALREAMRKQGYHKQIKNSEMDDFFDNLDDVVVDNIIEIQASLVGRFRCFSLHCGGIVIYNDGIPDDVRLISKNKNQIVYDKEDIERLGLFKVDILSNRGLAQLMDTGTLLPEEYPEYDSRVAELLSSGRNYGLTFAESPAMRKTMAALQPKSITDLAVCLAIIRPAAQNAASEVRNTKVDRGEFHKYIIFDDDAIGYISSLLRCSDDEADKYRKAFSKNKLQDIEYFESSIAPFLSEDEKEKVLCNLTQLRKYSFCKSHAISYAKLVWSLAHQKVYEPKKFWLATLNHCNSSYRKWVHFSEAKTAGIKLTIGKRPWKLLDDTLVEAHCDEKPKTKLVDIRLFFQPGFKPGNDSIREYKMYGYWMSYNFLPDMYLREVGQDKHGKTLVEFRGLIACGRCYKFSQIRSTGYYGQFSKVVGQGEKKKFEKDKRGLTFITIGYETGKFADIVLYGLRGFSGLDVVAGRGVLDKTHGLTTIQVSESRLESL